ncbi:MAG TPA: GldG family protein [Terriglobales bacterium]|nr:GldG family protein [Terriglobales bacterium]
MTRWDRRLALACAATGVPLVLAALALALADGGLSQRTAYLLLAGVALVIVYAVVDPRAVVAMVRDRRSRPGSLAVLASAAVLGLVVAANVVASRSLQAADLTRSGQFTLSPQSIQVIQRLDSDLAVTGFFRPDQLADRRDLQTLLDLYRQRSGHVKVRFADPQLDAGLALSLGARAAGSVVLQYRTRPPVVLDAGQQSESDVTTAIERLESARTPVACWAGGDGERDLKDTDEVTGYSAVADLLRSSSYQTREVLPAQQAIPTGCDALVVLQLGRPLSAAGAQAIQTYLAGGGKLLLAVDPWVDPQIVASVNGLLRPYGAAFGGGLVIEPDPTHAAANDSTVPVVYDFGASPITTELAGRYVFFPAATSISGTPAPGTTSAALASTTDRAYAIPQERTDLSHRAGDTAGPFVLMRSIEQLRGGRTTRIVLAGTSALAENRTMPPAASSANPDLLLGSLDWLSQQDSLVEIPPRPRALPLSLGERDTVVNAVVALPLPVLAIIGAGLLVLARRRRRTA